MHDNVAQNNVKRMTSTFAHNEYKDYIIYKELARIESNPEFKNILQALIQQEFEHYTFWKQLSQCKEFKVSRVSVLLFVFFRKILGLTFIAKYLEKEERQAVKAYHEFMSMAGNEIKEKLQQIIDDEKFHEKEFISQIKEEKIQFMGSIILGLNDGLIELTGALVGFSFALHHNLLVGLTGIISGIAACLSMASSAYMQAKHEEGKNAKKAALYTGFSYIIVVLLLVTPFFIINKTFAALSLMGIIVLCIIVAISYFTSVVFDRNFRKQFMEIFAFSVGVALVAFILGSLFRMLSGIQL